MSFERLAPAKINLFLHVGPASADGYHPIVSLMAFADVGDFVRIEPSAVMGFDLEGPFAGALNSAPGNLVLAVRDLVIANQPGAWPPFKLTLDKQLPVAAGLGGGSADAAATLALLADWARAMGLPAPDEGRLAAAAEALGADIAACRAGRTAIARGRGEILSAAPRTPVLDAVLVNPGRPLSTAAVYRAFDASGVTPRADAPVIPNALASAQAVADFLRGRRNDLEAPAMALEPLVGEVITELDSRPETLIARMSGSGATCFGLCAGEAEAERLAEKLKGDHPSWWVRRCRIGDRSPPPG